MQIKHSPTRFAVMQIGYWCAYGAFITFCVSYALELGMTRSSIGLMAAANTLFAFVGQFFWSSICDKVKTHKNVFIIGCLLLTGSAWLFYRRPSILAFGLVGFMEQPIGVVLDTWVIKSYVHEPYRFGHSRAWSTFAFALLMPIQGNLIEKYGYSCMIIGMMVFLGIALIACLFTADAPLSAGIKTGMNGAISIGQSGSLIRSLLGILTILFIMGAANAPQIKLTAMLVANVGGSVLDQSYVMFCNSIAQSPVLMFSKYIDRVKPINRLTLASGIYVLTLMGISLAKTPTQLMCFYLLNGLGGALYLPAMRKLMQQLSPHNLQTTAQGIGDATYQSLSGVVSTALSGIITEHYGILTMVLLCLGLQVFAFILLNAYRKRM